MMRYSIKKFNNPLYKNSIYIYLNTIIGSAFGLLFWALATRLYSAEDVGITTALISSAVIIECFASFGLTSGLVKYLPKSANKDELFSSALTLSLLGSIFLGFLFISNINLLSTYLESIATSGMALIFILILITQISNTFINNGLLSLRKADYLFLQNQGLSVKIVFLAPLAFAGIRGIFGSICIAYVLSLFLGIFFLSKMNIKLKPILNKSALAEIYKFSLANYVYDILLVTQTSVLPIIVLKTVGPKETAYFYIAFSIVTLLYAIPNSVFTSMFVEGSHGLPLKKTAMRSLVFALLLLVPCGLIMFILGDFLLSLFSMEYSRNASELLKLLIVSSVFVTINAIFLSIKRIQNDNKLLVVTSALLFTSIILFCYTLAGKLGIQGVGLGWIIAQGINSILVIIILINEKFIQNLDIRGTNEI